MISKDSVGWRVGVAVGDEGALTDSQIEQLATDHGLDIEAIQGLSYGLAVALDPKRALMRKDVKPHQEARAAKEVEAAINDLEAAQKRLTGAKEKIASVIFKNLYAHVGMPNPSITHLERLDDSLESIGSAQEYLEVMKRAGLISFRDISDKRRLRDERRRLVCWSIFSCWQENGRKLSYTTDPISSERSGPLVAFVNSIVTCISDPPEKLSGETIKFEIDDFKARDGHVTAR